MLQPLARQTQEAVSHRDTLTVDGCREIEEDAVVMVLATGVIYVIV